MGQFFMKRETIGGPVQIQDDGHYITLPDVVADGPVQTAIEIVEASGRRWIGIAIDGHNTTPPFGEFNRGPLTAEELAAIEAAILERLQAWHVSACKCSECVS